jgi:hypothetical protein
MCISILFLEKFVACDRSWFSSYYPEVPMLPTEALQKAEFCSIVLRDPLLVKVLQEIPHFSNPLMSSGNYTAALTTSNSEFCTQCISLFLMILRVDSN